MLDNAFNTLLFLHSRPATISRNGSTPITGNIRAAPSNYYRNLEGPSDIVVRGREFVISKLQLDAASFPTPRRGDQLAFTDIGTLTITEVREMYNLGGEIMGFRVRTN